MRTAIGIALVAACGPMYQAPPGAPPPGPTGPMAPPDPSLSGEPGNSARTPDDLYGARAEDPAPDDPAASTVPAAAPSGGRRAAPRGLSETAAWVDAHNRARGKHCAPPLTWSAKLAQVAQHWANALRDRGCQFGHSGGSFGENLAAGTSGTLDPGSVVKMWYDEVRQYHFPDGGFSMQTGHFTQVVWRGTTAVGCGRSQCKGMDIFVCEYDPPGNWEGQYRRNVLPAGCRDAR